MCKQKRALNWIGVSGATSFLRADAALSTAARPCCWGDDEHPVVVVAGELHHHSLPKVVVVQVHELEELRADGSRNINGIRGKKPMDELPRPCL